MEYSTAALQKNTPPGGFIAMSRDHFNHPILQEKEKVYSRREAWLYLLGERSWGKRQVSYTVGKVKHSVSLDIGELLAAPSHLSEVWQWSKRKVNTFLEELAKLGWIRLVQSKPVTKLFIPNAGLQSGPQRNHIEQGFQPSSGLQSGLLYKNSTLEEDSIHNDKPIVSSTSKPDIKVNSIGEFQRYLTKTFSDFTGDRELDDCLSEVMGKIRQGKLTTIDIPFYLERLGSHGHTAQCA